MDTNQRASSSQSSPVRQLQLYRIFQAFHQGHSVRQYSGQCANGQPFVCSAEPTQFTGCFCSHPATQLVLGGWRILGAFRRLGRVSMMFRQIVKGFLKGFGFRLWHLADKKVHFASPQRKSVKSGHLTAALVHSSSQTMAPEASAAVGYQDLEFCVASIVSAQCMTDHWNRMPRNRGKASCIFIHLYEETQKIMKSQSL